MASPAEGRTSSLSIRNGARCEVGQGVPVEDTLVAVGECVGCENISSASRMDKAVVVFLKDTALVTRLVEQGITVDGAFYNVTPLASPTVKVTISNVPEYISDEDIKRELLRYGRLASSIRMIPLNCKKPGLNHVISFRRQVIMFLNEPHLDISFKVWHENKPYTIFASTGPMRCFECGDVGHKRWGCPHKSQVVSTGSDGNVEKTYEQKQIERPSQKPPKTPQLMKRFQQKKKETKKHKVRKG